MLVGYLGNRLTSLSTETILPNRCSFKWFAIKQVALLNMKRVIKSLNMRDDTIHSEYFRWVRVAYRELSNRFFTRIDAPCLAIVKEEEVRNSMAVFCYL